MIVASITTASAVPRPNIFMNDMPFANDTNVIVSRSAALVTIRPTRPRPTTIASVVGHPGVAGFLDPAQQEDLVVDGQAEGDGAQQHDHRQIQRRGREIEQR